MAAVIEKEKVYRPISGEEAIDLILNEFYKELVNSGLFPLHRVWHEFEIQGGVRVKGWATKVAEVKFEVSERQPLPGRTPENDLQEVEAKVAVSLAPAPPDLLRETLPKFLCSKCGREFKSKPAQHIHTVRWCKGDPDYLKKQDAIKFQGIELESKPDGDSQPDTSAA